MAAAALSFSLSLSSDPQAHQRLLLPFISSSPYPKYPFLPLRKSHLFNFKSSSSSPSSPSSSPITSASSSYSNLEDSFKTGKFLSNEELEKLQTLQNFRFFQQLGSGSMWVRVMRAEEIDMVANLLVASFAESMYLSDGFAPLLRFLIKQYLMERRNVMPYAATLVGFYRRKKGGGGGDGGEEEEEEFAGTVEVCFDKRGANASPPSPTPPKNSPYICNMTVKATLRRYLLFLVLVLGNGN